MMPVQKNKIYVPKMKRIIKAIKYLHYDLEKIGVMDADMWCKFDDAEKALDEIFRMIM